MLVAVDAPHFYAGIVFRGSVVIAAAPILQWTVGKQQSYLARYFEIKGWKMVSTPADYLA